MSDTSGLRWKDCSIWFLPRIPTHEDGDVIVAASLSLPFCKPEYFKNLWIEIEDSIFSNGRFAGHLFGKRDSWAEYDNMTFHTQPDIEKMFRHFSIEYFSEKEFDGFQAGGVPKHWHMYELVAKKK